MRSAGNFSPEWGYLAPAPSFMRTARIVVVATAIGAIAGAGVVLSLVDRPVANNDQASVDAPAVVSSVEAAPATGAASNDAAAGSSAAPVNVSTAAPARVLSAASVASRAVNPPTNVPAENPDVGRAADVGRSADSGKANVYPAPKPVQGMAALSDGSPASDGAPADAAYGAMGTPDGSAQTQKIQHHVADPFAASKPPALGTVLRHLFSAHNGNSYFPNN
jgi:hypothetical protein